jgi:RES domain-containing protein
MRSAWRIVKEKHAAEAFTGEGAVKFGGRWNSPGVRVVYTSGSQALAALELLVHLNPPQFFTLKAFQIHFDEGLVRKLPDEELPSGWKAEPPAASTMRLGDRWAAELRSPVLEVPSVLIPEESNYILNPLHPDFSRIAIGEPQDFVFDPRLL